MYDLVLIQDNTRLICDKAVYLNILQHKTKMYEKIFKILCV